MTLVAVRPSTLGLVVALLACADSAAAQASLEAPAEAAVGSTIAVTWTGPSAAQEFISIDPADAPSSTYGNYFYANAEQPATLEVPDTPGSYLIRYHTSANGYPVIASRPITVTDLAASFTALPPVEAGADVQIAWEGPAYQGDFISIDPTGAPERDYGTYAYTTGSPVTIRAPDEAGQYVVRYHLAGTYRVIGQTALTVGGVEASLTAPAEAPAGSEISVTWEGPDQTLDYISVDAEGAPEDDYGVYAYTRDGSPLTLRLPDVPGRYQVRYHMGQSGAVIGSSALVVLPLSATVAGPESVAAGTEFEARWTGPDNQGDYVTIVPVGADSLDYLDYAYTREGATLVLEAPLDEGPHELRYMTGRDRLVLATARITVTPGAPPGTLQLVAQTAAAPGPGNGAVEVILDASGSMLQRIGGVRRIELAKQALDRLVGQVIPSGTPFALRVFGHREADSCRTDLELPLSPLDRGATAARIAAVQSMNLAKTPIGASLALVPEDLAGAQGPLVVVLLTDGEETCDGDPAAAVQALRDSGLDVRVNIVGFAIGEQQLRETFRSWARAGNGSYFEANDGDELAAALSASLQLSFEVLEGDEVIATGIVGGEAVRLAPGTYQVRVLESPPRDLGPVTIEPAGEHTLDAGGAGQ